jgi:hypothetical protein
LFAAKLKIKSSNNSSAAFGIGVSEIISSKVSLDAVSTIKLSDDIVSDAGFLSVQLDVEKLVVAKIIIATIKKRILRITYLELRFLKIDIV